MKPTMHCHDELVSDLGYKGLVPHELIFKWFEDHYSTSKHLLTLYSIARGLFAKNILEIGFGRSSFVLARAASENYGTLHSCDTKDFTYLFNEKEKKVSQCYCMRSDQAFEKFKEIGFELVFIDYLGTKSFDAEHCLDIITKGLDVLKQDGILVIHDACYENSYVQDATNSLVKSRKYSKYNLEKLILPYNYGLCILRKKAKSKLGRVYSDQFLKKFDPEL